MLKRLPEEHRSQKQRDAMVDYERAEAKAPTLAEVESATRIHNALTSQGSLVNTNPAAKRKLEEAIRILDANRAYEATLGNRVDKAYVRPVKRIPDDLKKDFNFNWKSVYENTHPEEKLRDTEADYDKLKKYIDSNMYDLNDPVNLQKIAYDFHMYNPNTMKWTDFINSEQGNEFKKYLEDVRENQRKASIEKIFSEESNPAVDFMIPVAKEHAKKELLEGKDPNIWPALGFDVGTNLAMLGGGRAGLVTPPLISNVGQVVTNKEDPLVAGVNTMLGTGVNMMVPFMMRRGGRYINQPGKKYSQKVEVQGRVDDLARQAAETQKKFDNGAVHILRSKQPKFDKNGNQLDPFYYNDELGYINEKKKIVYTDDPTRAMKEYNLRNYTVKPAAEARNNEAGIIPNDEYVKYFVNEKAMRRNLFKNTDIFKPRELVKTIKNNVAEAKYTQAERDALYKASNEAKQGAMKQRQDRLARRILDKLNKGEQISSFDLTELYTLGYKPKESIMSFLWRTAPDAAKNYVTNFAGRKASAGATMTIPNLFFGTNLNKFVDEKKNKKPNISEIFGE